MVTPDVALQCSMPPRVAIPVPHSEDSEYAARAFPQYAHAVEMAGGEPVRIPLDQPAAEVIKLIEDCDAILLPGSKADVDPVKYKAATGPKTAPADPERDAIDTLLLQDAYRKHKPILGICYGLQILNVFRGGTLLQHIDSPVNHEAGREVKIAHTVDLDSGSQLGRIVIPHAHEKNVSRRRQLEPSSIRESHRRRTSRGRPLSGGRNHRSGGGD